MGGPVVGELALLEEVAGVAQRIGEVFLDAVGDNGGGVGEHFQDAVEDGFAAVVAAAGVHVEDDFFHGWGSCLGGDVPRPYAAGEGGAGGGGSWANWLWLMCPRSK